jgi:hypothetical protein
MMSACASPCSGGAASPSKNRGELTIAACAGFASGTLMTSMRKYAEFESFTARTQPGSSFGDRIDDEPET